MPETLEAASAERIDRIEARFAIAELIHEYARLIRRDRPDAVSALFAPDGSFEIRDGHPDSDEFETREHLASRDELHAYMMRGKGRAHPIPLIHNLQVEVAGDTATSNCVMEAQVYGTQMKVFGEYRDTFRRIDGTWLFASRSYTIYKSASSL